MAAKLRENLVHIPEKMPLYPQQLFDCQLLQQFPVPAERQHFAFLQMLFA